MKNLLSHAKYYNQYLILCANAIDHTEMMLCTLLTPWISKIFFPHHDPVIQLALGYSVLLTGFVTKPLGAFLFSLWAQNLHPAWALRATLIGSTLSMGLCMLCPEYTRFGYYATFGWLTARMLRGFFYAGQSTLSKVYTVEIEHPKTAHTMSYLYQFSTLAGYGVSSALASVYAYCPDLSWRWIGVFGILFALCAWGIKNDPSAAFHERTPPLSWSNHSSILRSDARAVCTIMLTTGVTYVTWNVAFVTLNALVPFATQIPQRHMLAMNTVLMVVDMALILCLGAWLKRYISKRIMTCAVLMLGGSFPFVMGLLDMYPSFIMVTMVRLWIVIWGVVLSCPLHLYYRSICSKNHAYSVVAVGTVLGGTLIGKATPAVSVWLYHTSGTFAAIGIYGAILCMMTYVLLLCMPSSRCE